MSLFCKKIVPSAVLGIWEITESLETLHQQSSLSAAERSYYTTLKSTMRKKHWLSYRLIVPHILPPPSVSGISYDEYGKPLLENGTGYVSAAHSGKFAALIASKNNNVGLDIEAINPKIVRISHKFLSAAEMEYDFAGKETESLSLIWCAKEALYKLFGKGGLSFARHLQVEPFIYDGQGTVTGKIASEHISRSFSVHYETLEGYMMAYVIDH